MNTHFKKILRDIQDLALQLKQWFLELTRIKKGIVIAIVLLICITVVRAVLHKKTTEEIKNSPRAVPFAKVSDL